MQPTIHIQLLTFEGCPNSDQARARIAEALEAEALRAELHEVEVESPERAAELRFLGSPSVRVNGEDVEPGADARTAYGLMCRTYGSDRDGAPPLADIRRSLRNAAASTKRDGPG